MKFLKKLTYSLLFVFFVFPFLNTTIYAQKEFSVDAIITYNVQDSGKTVVTHDITLENNFSNLYATTYTLSFENIDIQNPSVYNQDGKAIPYNLEKENSTTKMVINFPDAVVGKGSQRHFIISYDNNNFAARTGEVWEVSIPKLDDNSSFRSYGVVLKIPSSFGLEAYISPKPFSSQINESGKVYSFTKNQILQSGISAGFGQFQVFTYTLSYHLENPLAKSAATQIALPPDTAFQKVYLQKISPKPENVSVDPDGNWLATYNLSPHERVDVNVSGSVQIFASFRSFPKPTDEELGSNLKATDYWQVDDLAIKVLADKLKTPKAIYNYVTKTLQYDFSRVQPNATRMGALDALKNPTKAICMEFTDLFIALARAAGIPAREINGYAYTENPELQPISLVADVLHAWPEYYDFEKGVWIPVDPTWGSTSGGTDYFDKLDLRHFTFVIHGKSSTQPYPPGSYKLGTNPQKDVFVSFGKLPEDRTTVPTVSIKRERIFPFFNSIYSVRIDNPGPQALYSLNPTIYFDAIAEDKSFIEVMPPFSNYHMSVTVPFSLLGKGSPNTIEVKVDGVSGSIVTNKAQVIINSLLIIFCFLIITTTLILFRLRKISILEFFAKIGRKVHARFAREPNSNKDSP